MFFQLKSYFMHLLVPGFPGARRAQSHPRVKILIVSYIVYICKQSPIKQQGVAKKKKNLTYVRQNAMLVMQNSLVVV